MNQKKITNSKKGKQLWKRICAHKILYLFLAPTIIYLAIFSYAPMYGIQIAFKDYSPGLGMLKSKWVGLKHIKIFINSYYFWPIIKNTITLSTYSMLLGYPTPIFLALLLNEIRNKKYKKFIQTTLYAPHFISMVVMVGIIIITLSPSIGIINKFMEFLNLERQYFIVQPKAFKHIYVLSGIWQGAGWSAIIYLAALSNIDPQVYEASIIDGANRIQRVWYINIPVIRPTVSIILIMSIGRLISVGFEKALLLQNPLNAEASEVISTYVYKRGLLEGKYSFSAAIGFFNNIINIILLVLANFLVSKVSETSLF
jgi:putative aldouronate transport system permease protein